MTRPAGDEPQESTAIRRQNLHHGCPSPKRPRAAPPSRSPTPESRRQGYRVSDVVELRETTSCLQSDTLADACSKLCQSGRTAVLVLNAPNDEVEVQGVLTENDILQAIVEGVDWDQSLERWLQQGPARLPGFLVPPMTLGAETPLVEAAKLMSEQSGGGGKFSCHHLLVRVASGSKLDASGRPLKARLLSALDIANGMIEASKSSVAAERALALSVKHVMKPRMSVPSCTSKQNLAEAFRLLAGSQQNCVLVSDEKDAEACEEDKPDTDYTKGVVTPVDALLAFSEKISGEKRILRDWVRGVNGTPATAERFVEESTSLASAASTMAFTGQHHLLVVQAQTSHVLGVVSALDIVRALSRLFHVSEES